MDGIKKDYIPFLNTPYNVDVFSYIYIYIYMYVYVCIYLNLRKDHSPFSEEIPIVKARTNVFLQF